MLTEYLIHLMQGISFDSDQAQTLMEAFILSNNPEQMAAVLALLRAKGETAVELAAFVTILRQHQLTIHVSDPLVDIVGTGGDGAGTANISTMASVLVAACGVKVLKHGNRAVSSQSGSADVLEALGLNIELNPHEVESSLRSHGFGFCYASRFNPVFQTLKKIRQQLKVPTVFNLMGPLLNPGRAQTLLLGVSDPTYLSIMADCLIYLGVTRAMVVHGQGLDELNTIGPCDVIEIKNGIMQEYVLEPKDLGLPRCSVQDLAGGDALRNAEIFKRVIRGEESPLAQTVILNAGVALYLAGHTASMIEGLQKVRSVISAGQAQHYLGGLCHA